jgi:hypothetical protein
MGPDGALYEIEAINTASEITLVTPYGGSNGSGQSYGIIPTQSLNVELHAAMLEVVKTANEKIDPLDDQIAGFEQRIATKETEVNSFLQDANQKWPLVRVSPNQNCEMNAEGTGLKGWAHNGVTVTPLRTIHNGTPFSNRPADDQKLLAALGTNDTFFLPSINVVSVAWTGKALNSWLLFPGTIPFSQDFTVCSVAKLVSGYTDSYLFEGIGSEWSLCGANFGGTPNGYANAHPYARSTSGEVHMALPAVCYGHRPIGSGWGWFPSMFGTDPQDYTA